MQKAIVAIVGGIVTLASNFGSEMPENVLSFINAMVPVLTAGLVWLIPNRT